MITVFSVKLSDSLLKSLRHSLNQKKKLKKQKKQKCFNMLSEINTYTMCFLYNINAIPTNSLP